MFLPNPDQMGGRDIDRRYGYLCGVYMQKSWTELFQIEALLNEYKPERIIELGAGSGGTTLFLGLQALHRDIIFYSFDIGSQQKEQMMSKETRTTLRKLGVIYEEVDIYMIEERIGHIVQGEGRTLLYSDAGGSDGGKVNSVIAFCKYLKQGDVILVHDYNTPEFRLENAKTIETMCKVRPYNQEWLNKFDAKHGAFIK